MHEKSGIVRDIKRLAYIIAASVIMAFTIKSFAGAGGLFPGGFNGISLLIQRCLSYFLQVEVPFSAINYTLNIIPIYIGFRYLGKKLTIYSLITVVLIGFLTDIMPVVPITADPLLVAVFGGLLGGLAICLCLFGDATGGGADIIGIFLAEVRGIDSWNYIFAANVCVLTIAGLCFGWDKALYSIIYQFVSTQVLHALHKRYQQHTLWIITEHPDEVYEEIKRCTNHDATLFSGIGCYERRERPMIYSVVASDEVGHVLSRVRKVDPKAFVNVMRTEQVNGRFYKRPTD